MACKPLLDMIARAEQARIGVLELKEKPKRFDADRPHRYAVARIDRPGRLSEERMVPILRMLEYCGFSMLGDPGSITEMPDRPLYFSTLPIAGSPRASLIFELAPLGFRPAPSCKPWISAAGQREFRPVRSPVNLSGLFSPSRADGGRAVPEHLSGLFSSSRAGGDQAVPERSEATRHRNAVLEAGAAPLRVLHDGRFWVANAGRDDKARMQIMRSAGWLPYAMVSSRQGVEKVREKVGDGAWATKDPFLASPFRPLMSAAAARSHADAMSEARKRIRMSNAADAPDGVHIPAPEGLSYLPYQKAGIHMSVENPDGAFIADDMGLGKAQPLDAKVLTPAGWRRMGELAIGDQVIGANGRATTVTGIFDQGLKEVFRVRFSDGAYTECCDDHLWTVTTSKRPGAGSLWETLPLSRIREDAAMSGGVGKYRIPMVKPVAFAHQDDVSITDQAIREIRSIPDRYMVSSIDQRADLLARLILHCGNLGSLPLLRFASYEQSLVRDVVRLAESLGGQARFTGESLPRDAGGRLLWVANLSLPAEITDVIEPFRSARQSLRMPIARRPPARPVRSIEGVEAVGIKPCRCIRVSADDCLYVTDDYIVTHNTVQAAGIVNMRLDRIEDPDRKLSVLVICQANMKIGWQRELTKWLIRDDHSIGIAEGDHFPETDVVIINYDIADRHADSLRARQWDIVAGDEAQFLGNRDTRRTIAILGDGGREREMVPLARDGIFIPLSGTPIPSRTIQIYPLLSAMDPQRWGRGSLGREIFMERYCAPRIMQLPVRTRGGPQRDRGGRQIMRPALKDDGASRLKELQIRLRASGMVRRMKTDPRIMKSLPPKFRQVVELPIELTPDVREMLKSAEADFMALGQAIADQPVPHDEEAFRIALTEEGYAAFREMARMPTGERIDFQLMSRIRANLALFKAPLVANYLIDVLEASAEAERPQKIVCFGHHRKAIEAIRERVEHSMPGSVVTFLGGGSKKKRQEAVDRLQEDERVRLFLGSIGAASTGLTLTRADRVIFAELDWVPVQLLQAEDRVWRIGQTENVLSEFLVVGQSIEVSLARRIVSKLDVIAQAIGGNPRFSRRLEEIYASVRSGTGDEDIPAAEIASALELRHSVPDGAGQAQASLPF